LACLAAESACCVGSQCLCCCGRALQCSGSIGYPILVSVATVLCLAVRFLLVDKFDPVFQHVAQSSTCLTIEDEAARHACYGNQFVYRMSFALTLFFAIMMMMVACCRKAAHDGGWCLKVFVILGAFFGSCWIHDDTMAGYASVCLMGSSIFITIQILALLEWVYSWNEHWRALAEEDSSYLHNLLWSTIAGYVGSIAFIVLAILQFGTGGCTSAACEIAATCIVCAFFSGLSVAGLADHTSLLCSSMVTLYSCYYCWSALSGMGPDVLRDDGKPCNTLLSDDGSGATPVNIVFGLLLTVFGLAWSCYSSVQGMAMMEEGRPNNAKATPTSYAELEQGAEEEGTTQSYDPREWDLGDSALIKPLVAYHFIMMVCTMFMTMTVVNWDTTTAATTTTLANFGTGTTVVVAKALAQWFAVLLYIWTIVGQVVMAACGVEREFNFAD